MRIEWSNAARADVRAIVEYIAEDNPGAARKWVNKLKATVKRLAAFPQMGHVVYDEAPDGIREFRHGSYRVFYEVGASVLYIVRVWHGASRSPWAAPDDE